MSSNHRHGFGRLLGKRDKSPAPTSTEQATVPPDSAYASSETPSREQQSMARSTSDIVHAEKGSEIADIDKDRNLGLRPSTGEVFDQDTGEVVTVVTTTTTTTTTTTRKPGAKNPEVHQDVKRDIQEQIIPSSQEQTVPSSREHTAPLSREHTVPSSQNQSGPAEMPANTTTMRQGQPPVPQSSIPDRTYSSNSTATQPPTVPHKSLARKSGEYGTSAQAGPIDDFAPTPPLSPTGRNNFSYPSRNRDSWESRGTGITTAPQPQHHSQSSINDLRAAAKGIHGIGETLRGTLNKTIDDQFPRKNQNKAAFARSKNDAVLDRGRTEMQGIPNNYRRPEQQRTPTNDQSIPGQWNDHENGQENVQPTSAAGYGGTAEAALGANPPESRKSRSVGKLFKRKPVSGDRDEFRLEKSKSRERQTKYF